MLTSASASGGIAYYARAYVISMIDCVAQAWTATKHQAGALGVMVQEEQQIGAERQVHQESTCSGSVRLHNKPILLVRGVLGPSIQGCHV